MIDLIRTILVDFWATVAEMSPYLLFGFLMAGLISVVVSPSLVERHLGGRGIWPVLKSSLFGVPLPLCSCSVIPVSMSLYRHGASHGATVAFLLSAPQTGVDSILVTLSLLGPVLAIFRPIAAFITGVVGGMFADVFARRTQQAHVPHQSCTDECCQGKKGNRLVRGLRYGFVTLPRDIGRAMLVGLVVAAVISALVPDNYFADKISSPIVGMIVMMLVGIPIYVCATASVPIAAALIGIGLTPGAALVFLMTGPATNAASFVTIWKVLGKRTALIYLATVAGCALASGIFLDYVISGVTPKVVSCPSWMLPDIVKYISAVVLLMILVYGILTRPKGSAEA